MKIPPVYNVQQSIGREPLQASVRTGMDEEPLQVSVRKCN